MEREGYKWTVLESGRMGVQQCLERGGGERQEWREKNGMEYYLKLENPMIILLGCKPPMQNISHFASSSMWSNSGNAGQRDQYGKWRFDGEQPGDLAGLGRLSASVSSNAIFD